MERGRRSRLLKRRWSDVAEGKEFKPGKCFEVFDRGEEWKLRRGGIRMCFEAKAAAGEQGEGRGGRQNGKAVMWARGGRGGGGVTDYIDFK